MFGSGAIDRLSTLSVNTTHAGGGGASSTTTGVARRVAPAALPAPQVELAMEGSLEWILDQLAAAIHELEQVLDADGSSDPATPG